MGAFDYETIAHCQYPVPVRGKSYQEDDCEEPAIARGWWDIGGSIYLCKEHLDYILRTEESETVGDSTDRGNR